MTDDDDRYAMSTGMPMCRECLREKGSGHASDCPHADSMVETVAWIVTLAIGFALCLPLLLYSAARRAVGGLRPVQCSDCGRWTLQKSCEERDGYSGEPWTSTLVCPSCRENR